MASGDVPKLDDAPLESGDSNCSAGRVGGGWSGVGVSNEPLGGWELRLVVVPCETVRSSALGVG